MSTTEIRDAAMKLSREERVRLAEALLTSLDAPDPAIDAAWAEEAERRIDALDAGTTKAIPAAEIGRGHIEQTPGVRGGRPRVAGRRITVDDIVVMHRRLGQPVEEIVAKYDLSFADVHAAIAYYYDHQAEVDRRIAADDAFADAFKRDNPSKLHEKLRALRDA
jgi:putative addiction module component (TIGR02574 family)